MKSDIFYTLMLNGNDIDCGFGADLHMDPLIVRIFFVKKLDNSLQALVKFSSGQLALKD